MKTAFMAQWGSGKPVIGFAGEYDALPGLSQVAAPHRQPVKEGEPGHGCGHNLLGTGCLAAAAAVKSWIRENGFRGSIRYYGCPAEEGGGAKTFMARAGVFADLDAASNFHPDQLNFPSKGSNLGVAHIRFRFHGITAHAAGAPHLGRSALDAVELMNVGVNYLREHLPGDVRIHYAITNGGEAPNIVPSLAEAYYFIRAHLPGQLQSVVERVRKVANGAAMMTETRVEEVFESATSCLLNNHYLADLQYKAMQVIGPIVYSEDEIEFARGINHQYPPENIGNLFQNLRLPSSVKDRLRELEKAPLIGENFPTLDEGCVRTTSTDVGDLSWTAPLSLLRTACAPTAAAIHSWGFAAASGMSIGHKGMLHAARIMTLAAIELFRNTEHLKAIRQEFEKEISKTPYQSPLPDFVQPPQ